MNKKSSFKDRMKYLVKMIQMLWESDKLFLFSSIFEIVIVSSIPFVNMYLLAYTIKAFSSRIEFSKYVVLIGLFIMSWCLLNLFQAFVNNYNNIKGNLIGQRLYTNILEKCLDIDYQKLMDINILEKKDLATKALENGSFTALIVNFKNITANFIVLCGVVVIISQIEIYILLIAILVIIINGIFSYYGKKHKYNTDEEMVPINRKIAYYVDLSTNHATAKEVRLFNMKNSLLDRYKLLYNETLKILKKVFNINRNINIVGILMNFILELSIYFYLGFKLLVRNLISISEFTLYGNAIRQFKDSMSELLAAFADIDSNGRYLMDYFEFIEIPSEFKKSRGSLPKLDDITIRFENVSFIYPNQKVYALKNINITIKNNTVLSLVGENGSGKTTFIKLLTRLCDPTEGNIYLNGINIKDIDYTEYQKLFSVIFQDFKLYAFTIKENVTMLAPRTPNQEKEVMEPLKKMGLQNRVEKAKNGLDTYLYYIYDEDGIELSGGEGQKLATARVLYKDSNIFILDEPTAALDPRAEYEILSNFQNIIKNKTAIYISHRLSSCRFSDYIAVFKAGSIVEYGNHKSLMEQNGLYTELYNMQAQFYID